MNNVRLCFWVGWAAAWSALSWGTAQAAGWTATGALPQARYQHTATLLRDGKVLAAGGIYNIDPETPPYLADAALYDPATGLWTATGSLPQINYYHTATLLPNGKVLAVGGDEYWNGVPDTGPDAISAALYDPATGTWTAATALPTPRDAHTATLLTNGKVLVAGGYGNNQSLASAVLYNPASGTWTPTNPLPEARIFHTATLLTNGKVLVAGGYNDSQSLASAALYDPASGTWTATGSMSQVRYNHTATLLPNGKVLVAGGDHPGDPVHQTSGAELYDPATGTWSATGALPQTVDFGHTATLLPNGKVLVAGGGYYYDGHDDYSAKAALYDPANGTWSATSSMIQARSGHSATLLRNGKLLVAGGYDTGTNQYLAEAEIYTAANGGQGAPDFVVTAVDLTPAVPTVNAAFTAKVTVKNQGQTAGDAGQLLAWTDQRSAPVCGATADLSASIGVLAPGASVTLTLANLHAAKAGALVFRAFADGTCAILESNERNNQTTLAYRVLGAQPDFVVSAVALGPVNPKDGKIAATVTVKNQGAGAGDAGYLDVWANQPAAQTCGAQGDAWADIGKLAAGASRTVKLNLIPGAPGAKTFRAFVDSWCGTAEANENNNQTAQGYTAQ
ncbi:kelch repeat-containing protein [Methylomagnum ishizawai]|uniref:kelch repeat-containing protein n=1 Tax=Methylomagnum ishizawai TaxID=1760988 RepID=UPI001C342B86|nr:kelch repeat-containing protein [Methylomagnum ishizawai]BBL77018.1 hypothetical protein MishRS11D_41160 [Methylomagnum ishizawai]